MKENIRNRNEREVKEGNESKRGTFLSYMAPILDGKSLHVAHVCRKMGIFG